MSPSKLVKTMVGGATALLLIWVGAVVLSQLMVAIIPLLGMILAFGVWWNMVTGRRK